MGRLDNKLAIVIGANSGMGMATVEALSDEGAKVIMLCRNEKRGVEAFKKLMEKKDRQIELMLCDLGDYSSIRSFASQVKEKYKRIDILVNNAGFISLDRQETKEGLERQFGINHIGHFLLTTEVLDLMGEGSRIVVVASGARTAIFLATDESVKDISGEYFYRCKIAKSSRRSNDPELAKKLYEFSEALVKEKTQNAFNNFTL